MSGLLVFTVSHNSILEKKCFGQIFLEGGHIIQSQVQPEIILWVTCDV